MNKKNKESIKELVKKHASGSKNINAAIVDAMKENPAVDKEKLEIAMEAYYDAMLGFGSQ